MDPRKIFIWNVRGLNSTAIQSSVRSFIESLGEGIGCLQETKMPKLPE
jgi:exonuclease III